MKDKVTGKIPILFSQSKKSNSANFRGKAEKTITISQIDKGDKDYLCENIISQPNPTDQNINNSVHNSQKNYKCDSCGKSFNQAGNLKRHIKSVHNGH